MRPLDSATLALHGPCLIEASAGTGKTYTLAALYLRLVLEAGLDPAQILVVTFTKAATAELRGRIRSRLRDARLALDGQGEPDDTLRAVLARAGDAQALRSRLESALLRMDEAVIYTIHGFCQRVLQDHAFESGMLFDLEFEGEDAAAGLQVMQDFWRTRFHGAPPALAEFVLHRWGEPAGLWDALRALVGRVAQARLAPPPAWNSIDAALQALDARWRRAATLWANGGEPLGEVLKAYPGWNGNKYRRLAADLDELHAYFAQGRLVLAVPECGKRYLPAKIATGFKKGHAPPEHDFFAAWEALCEGVERLSAVVLHEALRYAAETLRERRRAARRLAYDDLLRELHDALHGPRAAELARGIRARHPVALIDEFQDTDAVQYGIFQRVYGPSEQGGLFMIGDPKQAIYSFRGGDIFTYMSARADAPEEGRYTLTRNWRSTSALVDALNTLFGSARAPFIYEPAIAFQPVEAAGEADAAPLRVEGAPPAPLQVWQLAGEALTKGAAEAAVAEAVAGEIARLLAASGQGRAQLGEAPLRAADLAVLVPTRRHAALVQGALRACGVRSVYTGQDSVYATEEAEELGRVLYALAHPAEEGALRGALLTRLLGVDVPALAALAEDERAWEVWLARFQRYHEQWRTRGFMAMFRGLLRELDVAPRLLGVLGGERRLTNLLQLGELLQEAARTRPPAALLRWLMQQRDQTAADEQMLRLESDEGLVHIVTIHSSKGLEYPVVFLPFPWHGKTLRKNEPLLFHDAHGALTLDLDGSDETHRALAAREALAESLRLLYVALTRAKYTCYLAWGPVNGAHDSALAYLLYQDAAREGQSVAEAVKVLAPEDWWTPWERLAQQGHVRLAPLPEHTDRAPLAPKHPPELAARRFGGSIAHGWRIESYSNLVARLEAAHTAAPLPAADAPRDIHAFPRGAQAGTCLHAVLEGLDFQSEPHERAPELARVLARYGYARQWQGVVERLVHDVLHAPLDAPLNAGGLCLAAVPPEARRPEIEFYFPLAPLRAERLDVCLRRAWAEPCELPPLPPAALEGMMRGFIDLVVEREQRFYVIDYKSNYLGVDAAAYARPALAAAVAQHRYDAQYLLYTVALHRYLAQRVPGYDYDRHMGGVYYLFLRGMQADAPPGQGVFDARPPFEVVTELDALLRGGGA
ncbi:exodeoxyribonuclease V subunit beta [Ectothiorhodospiraceae bacterium 2226]|nr:exodeoxyribonuclease V subunit beta [Ectothiorhodospiraceae bacterium 2226]